jgi:integrase
MFLIFLAFCRLRGHTRWAHRHMATIKMASLWKDPRTNILILRKRVPKRYVAVAGLRGGVVKLSTGEKDRKAALLRLPDLLRQWAELEAGWDRLINVVTVTEERAQRLAAEWAAWIASGARLETGGESSDVFDPVTLPEYQTPEGLARMWDRVEAHSDEAVRLANIEIEPATRPVLVRAMLPVAQAAYLQADLAALGAHGGNPALNPLRVARDALPAVLDAPPMPPPAGVPTVPFQTLFEAWRSVAVVKPRTATETRYTLAALKAFVGHDDAAVVTRDDLLRWRVSSKATGITNNTWNNRLSMLNQVFTRGVTDGKLAPNPADTTLRLAKSRTQARLPYSDDDATRILTAARGETAPTLRWGHWIMAFTGMRAGEVLQLTGGDIRQENGLWFLAVHEDDPGKSVKTGQARNVPIHDALRREGFVDYAQTIGATAPIFPDKKLGKHGLRGERAWNAIGKWVRAKVGITDKQKAPDHAWRHRMEDELRVADVSEADRDAILGHARKTTGRFYGVRGESLARLHRAIRCVPVPPGLWGDTPPAAGA